MAQIITSDRTVGLEKAEIKGRSFGEHSQQFQQADLSRVGEFIKDLGNELIINAQRSLRANPLIPILIQASMEIQKGDRALNLFDLTRDSVDRSYNESAKDYGQVDFTRKENEVHAQGWETVRLTARDGSQLVCMVSGDVFSIEVVLKAGKGSDLTNNMLKIFVIDPDKNAEEDHAQITIEASGSQFFVNTVKDKSSHLV